MLNMYSNLVGPKNRPVCLPYTISRAKNKKHIQRYNSYSRGDAAILITSNPITGYAALCFIRRNNSSVLTDCIRAIFKISDERRPNNCTGKMDNADRVLHRPQGSDSSKSLSTSFCKEARSARKLYLQQKREGISSSSSNVVRIPSNDPLEGN
ncbi:hypothetical protein OROMI_005842 [Orobanche minor]